MRLKEGYLLRDLAGSFVVVPVGQAAVDLRGMITLNETGAFLWKQLQSDRDAASLAAALCEVYDVTSDRAASDVEQFIHTLRTHRLLEEDAEGTK